MKCMDAVLVLAPLRLQGASCAKLPGRLACISTITDSSTLSPRSHAKLSKQPGLMHESPKECFDPLPTDNLLGIDLDYQIYPLLYGTIFLPSSFSHSCHAFATQSRSSVMVSLYLRLLGLMAAASPLSHLGLLTCAHFNGGQKFKGFLSVVIPIE